MVANRNGGLSGRRDAVYSAVVERGEVMQLKPCPFCGGRCDPYGWMTNGGIRGPECEDCGATATNVGAWNMRAEELWNRRPDPVVVRSSVNEAYDLIDHHLRNTLDDSDYADYSAALDAIYTAPQPSRDDVIEEITELKGKS